jgi:predicted DNA-binding transcriptional regulator YafY
MPHIKNALIRYRIIDKCLRNKFRPYPTKEDLRFACEESLYGSTLGEHVCNSTIEKDMYTMKMEFDAPIRFSKRHNGYYYTNPDYSISEIPLTDDDISSIKFAASTLAQFKDTALFRQFGFALDKILDRIALESDKANKDTSQLVQFEQGVATQGSELLSPIFQAIESKKVCYFYYESFLSGERKRRKVTPLLLKEYRNRWYMISFDMVKNTVITYALDRMDELDISDEVGKVPMGFNADAYFKHSMGITANDSPPQRVIFRANPVSSKYIQSQPLHASQKVLIESSDGCEFELFLIVSEELIRELLSYAAELEVIAPKALRDEVSGRLEAAAKKYGIE